MSILKIYVGSEFKDICALDIRLFKNGFFYKVKNGDKVFVNGQWKDIVCTLDFKWVIDETGSSCEQSPSTVDLGFDLASPLFDDGTTNITIEAMPATAPILKKNIVTGNYIFDLTFIELNSSGVGPGVFNTGFTGGIPPSNPYVNEPIGRISDNTKYPASNVPLYGTGYNGLALSGHIDIDGFIWVDMAVSNAITAWNPADPIYKMRLYNLDAEGEFGGSNPVVNTTYLIQTKRKKVSQVGDLPLDANGQLVSDNGLPQATQVISSAEPEYRVLNPDMCPAPQSWFGNSAITGNFTKDCSSGNTGSVVPYTLSANTYYRPTQAEADEYASYQFEILGQVNANLNGVCNPATYDFKWIIDTTASYCEGDPFTGFKINPTLKKVTDDVNELPLDVNNHLTSFTGQPQHMMPTPMDDLRYRVEDESCSAYTFIKSKDFQRNNCVNPNVGTIVSYQESYTSNVSLEDAENIANADQAGFDTRGQANANVEGECLPPLPSDAVGIIQVDIFDANLESYMAIDTASVVDAYNRPCYTGNNFVPMDGTEPKNCWLLASDLNSGNFRHQGNIARVINSYPGVASVDYVIVGRSNTTKIVSGAYALKGADAGYMIMNGAPGSYVPATAVSTTITTVPMSDISIVGGANGQIGLGIGQEILRFRYNVALKTLTRIL